MRRIGVGGSVLSFILVLTFPVLGHAQASPSCSVVTPCSVFWTANTEPDMKDYRVWLRKLTDAYGPTPLMTIVHPQSSMNATQFMGALGNLTAGSYALAVTARDKTVNESAKSLDVFFTFVVADVLPPLVPTVTILQLTIP